jgi:hypothetical protein
MSEFYATIKGNRGPATRQGSKASGIMAAAQSWEGSVITHLFLKDGETWVELGLGTESTTAISYTLYHGPLAALKGAAIMVKEVEPA